MSVKLPHARVTAFGTTPLASNSVADRWCGFRNARYAADDVGSEAPKTLTPHWRSLCLSFLRAAASWSFDASTSRLGEVQKMAFQLAFLLYPPTHSNRSKHSSPPPQFSGAAPLVGVHSSSTVSEASTGRGCIPCISPHIDEAGLSSLSVCHHQLASESRVEHRTGCITSTASTTSFGVNHDEGSFLLRWCRGCRCVGSFGLVLN